MIITQHEAAGQTNDLLVEELAVLIWQHDLIGNDVVEQLLAPRRSREPEIVDDDRRRPGREQRQPGIARMACKIDKNIDLRIVDRFQDFAVELCSQSTKR